MYNRTTVYICGQPFTMLTKDSSDYVTKIANTLDAKLNEYLEADSRLSNFSASVLSNMHYISELEKATGNDDNLQKQVKSYAEENEVLRKRLATAEKDLRKFLKNDNDKYIDSVEYEAMKNKLTLKDDEIKSTNEKKQVLKNVIIEKDNEIKSLSYKITELENKILILEKQNNILRYGNK